MKWCVNVGLRLSIDYDDIEADSREEAEEIAKDRAMEDIDYNNAVAYDAIVNCCYTTDEDGE
jgi:hypothetical protein